MKKRANAKGKNGVFDFHFILDKTSFADEFVKEADEIGRSYTEHFKRILNERYQPKEQ